MRACDWMMRPKIVCLNILKTLVIVIMGTISVIEILVEYFIYSNFGQANTCNYWRQHDYFSSEYNITYN